MADGRTPKGERYQQLSIIDMFRRSPGGSSNAGRRDNHDDQRRGGSSSRGGPIRNKPSSSSRYSSGSGRERNRDYGRGNRFGGYEDEDEEDSSQSIDFDSPGPKMGTSTMLRATDRGNNLRLLNRRNAQNVVAESAQLSRALFGTRNLCFLYNALDIKPLGQDYCPGYRLPPNDPEAGRIGCRIRVVNQDTVDCTAEMVKRYNYEMSQMEIARDQGNTEPDLHAVDHGVACMNLANAHTKGGGFLSGSIAQEEAIMGKSTLWATLDSDLYPLTDTEAIYSPYVCIYKIYEPGNSGDETDPGSYKNMERAQAILVAKDGDLRNANKAELPGAPLPEFAVITVAAFQGPPLKIDRTTGFEDYAQDEDRRLMFLKIRQSLRIAALNGHRRLVLGALGCGVFRNPKRKVAEMFLAVLREREFQGGWWKEITFACFDKPGAGTNYDIFGQVLNGQVV